MTPAFVLWVQWSLIAFGFFYITDVVCVFGCILSILSLVLKLVDIEHCHIVNVNDYA